MDGNAFLKFFAGILLLAMAIFYFFNSNFEFECPLFKGGYYHVQWMKDKNRFDVFYWQPKQQAKPLPNNIITIQGEAPVKPVKKHF